jgi:hypothetical protein
MYMSRRPQAAFTLDPSWTTPSRFSAMDHTHEITEVPEAARVITMALSMITISVLAVCLSKDTQNFESEPCLIFQLVVSRSCRTGDPSQWRMLVRPNMILWLLLTHPSNTIQSHHCDICRFISLYFLYSCAVQSIFIEPIGWYMRWSYPTLSFMLYDNQDRKSSRHPILPFLIQW